MTSATVVMFGPQRSARGGIATVATAITAELVSSGLSVVYVDSWVEGGVVRNAWVFLRALVRAGSLSSNTIAHVHMSVRGSFVRKSMIVRLARLRGAKVVVQLHSGTFSEYVSTAPWMIRRAMRQMLSSADVILALSASWKEEIRRVSGHEAIVVLPNPVRMPKNTARMNGPRRVTYLGRLSSQKGTPELLEAIAILQSRGLTDVEWLLAGDGDTEGFMRLAAQLPFSDRVRVSAWLEKDSVWRELENSWVFCMPSHFEGQPMALLEAMASGVACVATPVGGIPELIESGVNGVLSPVGSPEQLADALQRVLESRDYCLSLGANARAEVSRRHVIGEVGRQLRLVYDRVQASTRCAQ